MDHVQVAIASLGASHQHSQLEACLEAQPAIENHPAFDDVRQGRRDGLVLERCLLTRHPVHPDLHLRTESMPYELPEGQGPPSPIGTHALRRV